MDAITFKRDKETKNKIRFTNASYGSLYLTPEEAGDKQEITVSVK